MADYSAYLPVTPPSSAFLGLSPEETAQLAQYRTPDNVGRIHPMGGHALAGHQRYQQGMGEYLDAVVQGNKLRQQQLQEVMSNNLTEAGINQMGRIGPELIRSGDTRFLAGSRFAQEQLPGLTAEGGGPSDMSIEADTNARALKEAQRQKDLADSANAMQQAGYTPEVQALAEDYNLPLTKSQPTSVQVAALRARSGGGSSGRPLLMGTRQHYEHDAQGNAYLVTDRNYGLFGSGPAGGGGQASTTTSPTTASPATLSAGAPSTTSTTTPIPPGYVKKEEEELSDSEASSASLATSIAEQNGYEAVGIFTVPGGETVLMAQNAAGHQTEIPLDQVGSGEQPADDTEP